jgi:long-chain acyl-CoA synthetase
VSEVGFFALAERVPDRPALVDPSGRTLAYGQLADWSDRLGRGLREAGMSQGDTLALVLPSGSELLALYAAAIRAGLRVVVVNWHLTAGEIAYILDNSAARMIVAHERFADAAGPAAATLPAGARWSVGPIPGFRPLDDLADPTDPADAAEPAHPADRAGKPEDPVPGGQVMFYTSGTTGRPKGVRKILPPVAPELICLSTGIGVRALPLADALASDAVTLVGGPLYHAAPLASAAMALDGGGKVVLMDGWTAEAFLELVERHGVTQASMVPTMFHRLLALPEPVRKAADVSSLRSVSHAGAPCPLDVKRRMIEWWGPIITESYSATEGAGTSVTSAEWLERPGTVGRPSPGVTLRIVDDDGRDCPVGTPGRVYLSQTLWRFEYHGDPEKTDAQRLDGMFTVGDIGYVDDAGYLFLCDRVADVIVSGGVNIYPAEVEGILLEHPAVADAVVVGAPNDEWGEEVRAVVEPAAGVLPTDATAEELIAYCRDRLAHYKCPVAVDFVATVQRDPNGKVRKAAIRDRYWEGRARKI